MAQGDVSASRQTRRRRSILRALYFEIDTALLFGALRSSSWTPVSETRQAGRPSYRDPRKRRTNDLDAGRTHGKSRPCHEEALTALGIPSKNAAEVSADLEAALRAALER